MNSFSAIDPTRGSDFHRSVEGTAPTRALRDGEDASGNRKAVLAVVSGAAFGAADRLMNEYELREELDALGCSTAGTSAGKRRAHHSDIR